MRVKVINNNKYLNVFNQGNIVEDIRYIILVTNNGNMILSDDLQFSGVILQDKNKIVDAGFTSTWYKKDFRIFFGKLELEND